jgi:hypothetical protein
MSMRQRDHKIGHQDAPPQKILASHSWGKPVHRGSSAIGYVTVGDRGWGGFRTTGELIAVSHSEHAARQAVLARGPRECE